MKKCELCDSPAKMYCESDQASLCWDCDSQVHGANFLFHGLQLRLHQPQVLQLVKKASLIQEKKFHGSVCVGVQSIILRIPRTGKELYQAELGMMKPRPKALQTMKAGCQETS
ncbi:hypothetical protein FH972_000309 [Carpinus fangiana]|uniref:B box-type domain-containing protein n=1 Tax=Carpinus fangiana TaxID=176857 RepID=A0A5N6Q8I0_9ROSI|nr:hypothetical protein FH972_000309 [Carpinus fangiana]